MACRVLRGVVVALVGLVAACADEPASTPSTGATTAPPVSSGLPTACPAAPPALVIDQIDEALAAINAGRDGVLQYFEVNATADVVNVFVAGTGDDGASIVVPHSYAAGQVRAEEPTPATGNTFGVDAIDFDAQRVLSCVAAELPDSTLEAFVIEGGAGGVVRYTVIVNSSQGGQLVVEVTGDGRVVAVDAM